MSRNYQKRSSKEYNGIRAFCQWVTCHLIYGPYYKLFYNFKVEGRENVSKNEFYIIASNHVSAIDPFLVINAVKRNTAYMAKKELFENPIGSFFLNILGAFAVDRSKLSVSTIKTVLGLKETDWCLGIFPQGTREQDGNMENLGKGFASFAKTLKCSILPVAITGCKKEERKFFKSKIKVKIGKPIEYRENVDELVNIWSETVKQLAEGNV